MWQNWQEATRAMQEARRWAPGDPPVLQHLLHALSAYPSRLVQ